MTIIKEQIQSLNAELANTWQTWLNLDKHSVDAAVCFSNAQLLEQNIIDLESQQFELDYSAQFGNQDAHLEPESQLDDSLSQKIEQCAVELDKTRKLWMQGVPGVFRDHIIKLEVQLSKLKAQQIDFSHAGELAQSSQDSVSVYQERISPAASPETATYSQTLLDGIYDLVAPVVTKVKAKFSKPVDDSPPPIQITLFDLLKPFAKAQYEKMQALFRLYNKDLEQLKNPLSQLSKLLGKRRQTNLDGLSKQAAVLAKDMVAYGLMWEVL